MGPTWPFLLMFRSHDLRHSSFSRLKVVNETHGFWGVTETSIIVMFNMSKVYYCKELTLYSS